MSSMIYHKTMSSNKRVYGLLAQPNLFGTSHTYQSLSAVTPINRRLER